MIQRTRNTASYHLVAAAGALLFAFQVILAGVLASRMEASALVLGSAAELSICASDDHPAPDDVSGGHSTFHKSLCDICIFAAQTGIAPTSLAVANVPFGPAIDVAAPRHASAVVARRHQPRLTRGPPIDA